MIIRVLLAIIVTAALIFAVVRQLQQPNPAAFTELASMQVDGNAEIVAASADGQLLVHTNTKRKTIDVIDLTDPAAPVKLAAIGVPGEPTSVGLSPDGRWALAVVHVNPAKNFLSADNTQGLPDPRLPGVLAVIDLANPAAPVLASIIGIDNHPDSIAVTAEGEQLVAIIAIENEQIWVSNGAVVDGEETPPGDDARDISSTGAIQLVRLNPEKPRNWSVNTVELNAELLRNALMLTPEDPQPEFVALSPGRHMAAVSLQENNGIVLIDLTANEISGAFTVGVVSDRPADLKNDGEISLSRSYPGDVKKQSLAGTRFPDGIAFTPNGQYLLSADEGEQKLTGGRGFSIWSLAGEFIWDDGGEIEKRAAKLGLYPDNRSESKGIEIEGVVAARFGSRDYAFAVAERGSFMAIYDISNAYAPEFVQILPTGDGPEGIIAIPARNLIIVAAEESGTITIFQYNTRDSAAATED